MFEAVFSLQTFEYFLLVLIRLSTFFYAAPFFNVRSLPARIRIGMAGTVAVLLISVLPEPTYTYHDVIGYGVIAIQEGITGLLLGFSASICNSIVLFAGTIIDMQIGLSMAQEFNPMIQMTASVTGSLYNYFVLLILISSHMYEYVVRAVCDSYKLISVGGQVFQWDRLMTGMTDYMTNLLILGFRIALPIFVSMMVTNCVLGIMAKVAPQMNMFTVGIQLKLLAGLVIIFISMSLLPTLADFLAVQIKRMIVFMIKGMYVSG